MQNKQSIKKSDEVENIISDDQEAEIYNLSNLNVRLENDLLKLSNEISYNKTKVSFYHKNSKLLEDNNNIIKDKIQNITNLLDKKNK